MTMSLLLQSNDLGYDVILDCVTETFLRLPRGEDWN